MTTDYNVTIHDQDDLARIAELGDKLARANEMASDERAMANRQIDARRKAEAALAERDRMLRLAAADYWREQMDGLPDDAPVAHIVDATIEKWRARVEEGSENE